VLHELSSQPPERMNGGSLEPGHFSEISPEWGTQRRLGWHEALGASSRAVGLAADHRRSRDDGGRTTEPCTGSTELLAQGRSADTRSRIRIERAPLEWEAIRVASARSEWAGGQRDPLSTRGEERSGVPRVTRGRAP
jgi:hypothetical protein